MRLTTTVLLALAAAMCLGAQELSPDIDFLAGIPGDPSYFSHELTFSFGRVTGKPYSAEETTKSVRVLADGNRILNYTTTRIFRDNEGRVRREVTLTRGGSDKKKTSITISDPVAGVNYSLDPDTKIARKTGEFPQFADTMAKLNTQLKSLKLRVPDIKTSDLKGLDEKSFPFEDFANTEPVRAHFRGEFKGKGVTETHEDLGTEDIGGIQAEGSKDTTSIPAGVIGNEKPIVISSERWVAKDLGIDVKTVNDDPRFGKTEFTINSLKRTEPDPALFRVPPGYKVETGDTLVLPLVKPFSGDSGLPR